MEARAAASARLANARKEARTSCHGLLDGQRFESIADRADDEWSGPRNGGPPGHSKYTILVANNTTHLMQHSQAPVILVI